MVTIFTDGATEGHNGKLGTVTHCGIGFYCEDDQYQHSSRIEAISNNEAEWTALIQAMIYAIEKGYDEVEFKTDSMIVVRRMNRRFVKIKKNIQGFKATNPKKIQSNARRLVMDSYQKQAMELQTKFKKCLFTWIPREKNEMADMLSKASLYV